MNKNDLPDIGDRIEIESISSEIRETKLVSQVLDIMDPNTLFIAMPIVNNVIVPMPVGDIIRIKYAKKSVGVFVFHGKVISRKHTDNLSYMKIERINEVKKVQRRDYFRLEVVLDVQLTILNSKGMENGKVSQALTRDISGGGVRLVSKTKLFANDLIEIVIKTGESNIKVKGKVIRCIPSLSAEQEYDIAVIFEEINESDRKQIVSFIFSYQRKMKNKGLI